VALAAVCWKGQDFLESLRPPATLREFCRLDFSQDWISAQNFFVGAHVYESQQTAVRRIAGDNTLAEGDVKLSYNAHPPGAVLLALPFGLLDFRLALVAWNAASLIAVGASLCLIFQMLQGKIWGWVLLPAACFLVSSHPLQETLHEGQFNGFLLLLLTAAWFAARQRSRWVCGALLALATYLKLFPGLFFVVLLFQRDFKTFWAAVVCLAGLALSGVLVLGLESHQDYLFGVVPAIGRDHLASWNNHSLPGLWGKVFNPGQPSFEPLVQSAFLERMALAVSWAGVLLLLWLASRREAPGGGVAATIPLATVAMILLSPVAWNHYFVILLLPTAWLFHRLATPGWRRVGLILCVAILWLPQWTLWKWALPGPFEGGKFHRVDGLDTLTGMAVQLYAVLGLLALCFLEGSSRAGSGSRVSAAAAAGSQENQGMFPRSLLASNPRNEWTTP
jgi:hypothetical protein